MKAYISSSNVIYLGNIVIAKITQKMLVEDHITIRASILTEEEPIIDEKFNFNLPNKAPMPELAKAIVELNETDIISYDDIYNKIQKLLTMYNK